MTNAAGSSFLDELPQLVDDPGPSWCAVANVVKDRPYGPGGVEIRHGSKHFAPGAKVHLVTGYWGMGGENVTVVGRHRGSRRFVMLDIRSDYLRDWRTELAYSPFVTRALAAHGEYTCHDKQGPDSAEAKRHANEIVTSFIRRHAAIGPRYVPASGPLPDEAKAIISEHGPTGLWSSLPAGATEQPGSSEIRFFNGGNGLLLPYVFDTSLRDPIRFCWRLAAPGRLRLRALAPDEPIPASWDRSCAGSGWEDVVYEFRLVIKPMAAFEALSETNRDGFWLSPLPLIWAGHPFRLAP